ncbi:MULTISPECIES: host-nuclease inhibitor Gam family protein [Staphylococcus]|uniref:host-nuclease inhibitor Gam family protein n=1 Tax=Staphylococcus TaxID=1279 RepID=UPI001F462001|nr:MULTISPECIES: host-nuclease inhibitor Gam family protein [Staphylococcus]MCE4992085.1 host-nuclease inhibitor Gam family protein [Staphylococcus haemolyticus]
MNQFQELELQELRELDNFDIRETFKIKDLKTANWAFKKLNAISNKENEINNLAGDEIARIETWQEKELNQIQQQKEYLEHLLKEYYIQQKENDKKFKLSTPYGKVSSRVGAKVLQINNEQAIIDELEKRGLYKFIKISKKLNQADIKKDFNSTENGTLIDANGEVLEGIYLVQKPTTYTVKAGD